jgi:hypothetical protein
MIPRLPSTLPPPHRKRWPGRCIAFSTHSTPHGGSIPHGPAIVENTWRLRFGLPTEPSIACWPMPGWSKTCSWNSCNSLPALKTIADLVRPSPLLTFADTPVFAIEPPAGFEALATVLAERCAAMIVYERGIQRSVPWKITLCLVLEVHGVAYVVACCHGDRNDLASPSRSSQHRWWRRPTLWCPS